MSVYDDLALKSRAYTPIPAIEICTGLGLEPKTVPGPGSTDNGGVRAWLK